MADLLTDKIKFILRDWTGGSSNLDEEIDGFSERFAEIASSDVNRPLRTKKQVQMLLGELRSGARKLIRQFDSLPPEALAAMELDQFGRLRLVETLLEVVWRAEDGTANDLGLRSKNPGPQVNYAAVCTTLLASRAWHRLTDKKPTPGTKDRVTGERSDFERFLGQIFDALEIKANSEHYARELSKGTWREMIEERYRRAQLVGSQIP